jgi:hypothetical protein
LAGGQLNGLAGGQLNGKAASSLALRHHGRWPQLDVVAGVTLNSKADPAGTNNAQGANNALREEQGIAPYPASDSSFLLDF